MESFNQRIAEFLVQVTAVVHFIRATWNMRGLSECECAKWKLLRYRSNDENLDKRKGIMHESSRVVHKAARISGWESGFRVISIPVIHPHNIK